MTTTTLPDDVQARIEKLLAMSTENGATENEAIVASKMVNKILQEYSMSISDVIMGSAKNADIGLTHEVVQIGKKFGKDRQFDWTKDVFHMVASHNNCKILLSKKLRQVTIIGLSTNIKATKTLAEWLVTQYWTMQYPDWLQYRKETGLSGHEARGAFEPYKESYFQGMTGRITVRLQEMKEQIMSTALVVKMDDRIEEYMSEEWGRLGQYRSSKKQFNSAGFRAGQSAGSRVDVGQGKMYSGAKALNA